MAWCFYKFFYVYLAVPECVQRLICCHSKTVFDLAFLVYYPHSLASAACRGFYQHRVAELACYFFCVLSICNNTVTARNNRYVSLFHCIFCIGFITHRFYHLR